MDRRLEQLKEWVESQVEGISSIQPASEDASFRRYFRIRFLDQGREQTAIVMDAPPEKEDSAPFIAIAGVLRQCGINAPQLFAVDLDRGFLLLSDLGILSYLDQLNDGSVGSLYGDALDALLTMQTEWPTEQQLPPYDRLLLLQEMESFPQWYLGEHRKISPSLDRREMLNRQFALLADSALGQPQVVVHRDYHSRNLMVVDGDNPGVIDFQDAVWGPVTYDLVSLLRDCYIDWPRDRVEGWAESYFNRLVENQLVDSDWPQFLRWFDWMGVQRHLKAIGIFSRLNYRDGKPGYLDDIPRTMDYVVEVTARYPELEPLNELTRSLR